MSLNTYIPQDNGNLKHLAEIDAGPDQIAEAIELVQENFPRQKDGPFVVIDVDSGFCAYVEFEEEMVPKRVLKIGGVTVNGTAPTEEAAPKRRATRAPAKTTTAKRAVKKAAPKAAAPAKKAIKRGTGFKRNAASAE